MARLTLKSSLDGMCETLIVENALLQTGRTKEIAELSSQKLVELKRVEAALANQDNADLTKDELRSFKRLIDLSKENAVHFDAVRHGLSAVIRRLNNLDQKVFVGAYSASGVQLPFSGASGGYLKKV